MSLEASSNINHTVPDFNAGKAAPAWKDVRKSASENGERSTSIAFARSFTIDNSNTIQALKGERRAHKEILNDKIKKKEEVEKKIGDLVTSLNVNHQTLKAAYNTKNKLESNFFLVFLIQEKLNR